MAEACTSGGELAYATSRGRRQLSHAVYQADPPSALTAMGASVELVGPGHAGDAPE